MTTRPLTAVPILLGLLLTSGQATAAPELPVCPKGTQLEGAAPPAGTAAWCTGPDLLGQPRRNGPFRRWRSNGQLLREGAYVDGKKQGRWTEYNQAGQVVAEAEYSFGKMTYASGASQEEAAPRNQPAPRSQPVLAKAAPQNAEIPARAEPTARPAPVEEEWVSHRRDDGFDLETQPGTGKSDVGAQLKLDNTLATFQSALLYAPQLDLTLNFGSFLLEAQWGVAVLAPPQGDGPSVDTIATPLNPLFLLGGALDYDGLKLKMGVGVSIPVHSLSLDLDLDALTKIAAAAMLPTVRGMRDIWVALPEIPVVVIPVRGQYELGALQLGFEAVTYFGIPIHGGSSDLGLQLGGGATYGVDVFRFGGDLHLVTVGVTSGNFFLTLEPKVGVVLGPAEIYASLSMTPVHPDLGPQADFLWSTNLGIQLSF